MQLLRLRGSRRLVPGATGARGATPKLSLLAVRVLGTLALLLPAVPAEAFEFFDGRLQAHGFVEVQVRTLSRNYDDDWDLSQWYNVLNVELEFDAIDDRMGPVDLLSFFARVEARYDCVWTRGCGLFRSADTYGDRSKRLPRRLSGARRNGLTGTVDTGDGREIAGVQAARVRDEFKLDPNLLDFRFKDVPVGNTRRPAYLWHFPGVDTLFSISAPDPNNPGETLNPAVYTFDRFVQEDDEYRFGLRNKPGPENNVDFQTLGPWRPKDHIFNTAALADRANPFNDKDINPISGLPGSTELPFRPAPNVKASFESKKGQSSQARGLFIPNDEVIDRLDRDEFDNPDVNFRQAELEWNRGASQQDEKELKELYMDVEFFDSRLWLRLGKQSIVWGKTELFRTTDQMNPQDLGLASLPSLEESRISLWAARAVWSFYEVGPLSDVRLEFAFNFDQFEPVDIGDCGEPYAPNASCTKQAGLFAHGLVGQGLAGEQRPDDPWEGLDGLEGGVRLEFRWERFSFALTNFYGYDDFPYLERIRLYERNVDPISGRPRLAGSGDATKCRKGTEVACLQSGSKGLNNALRNHHANQQRFAVICSASVGFSDLDPTVCAQSILNSQSFFAIFPISQLLSHILRGNSSDSAPGFSSKTFYEQLTGLTPSDSTFRGEGLVNDGDLNGDGQIDTDDLPLIALTNDGDLDGGPLEIDPTNDEDRPFFFLANNENAGLSTVLSTWQEALLGCGKYWETNCDKEGIDLLNTEASIFAEGWPGQQGTSGDWDSVSSSFTQPGTTRFDGPAICTRWIGNGQNRIRKLPGCRGVLEDGVTYEDGWTRRKDGTPPHLRIQPQGKDILTHAWTGQLMRSEMTAFSWNALMLLIGFSGVGVDDEDRAIDEFKASDPFRTDGCSYRKPQLCSVVQAFYAILHTTRKTERAGGNGTFGRAEFDWHQGGSAVLRYQKRNVLGFSMDFAEDVTKSNWSMEFTWIEGLPFQDADDLDDGIKQVDTYNLTVSVDRPTFINFLNQNRTFFINSQWFFQYVAGYRDSFPTNGPVNVLATLSVQTGYFQDRLLPSLTMVYDFKSVSGAGIPQITYLFTSNFSITVGAAAFFGRWEGADPAIANIADNPIRVGKNKDREFVENGLAQIRDRDEVFLRLRYTF